MAGLVTSVKWADDAGTLHFPSIQFRTSAVVKRSTPVGCGEVVRSWALCIAESASLRNHIKDQLKRVIRHRATTPAARLSSINAVSPVSHPQCSSIRGT